MKSYIKTIAVIAAGILCTTALPAKNGIEVGYLNSTWRLKPTEGSVEKSQPMSGFYVGLIKDMRLFAGLSIQPGLSYYYLNSRESREEVGFNIAGTSTEHMLNIPVHIKYTFDIIPALSLYIFAGPTMSVGLAATDKISVTGEFMGVGVEGSMKYDSYTGKVKTENFSDEVADALNQYLPQTRMNRFDVLMGGGIGLDLVKFITVKGGFDYGLLNRLKGDLADAGTLNRMQYYVSIGIKF